MRRNARRGSYAGVALVGGFVAGAVLVAAVVGLRLWKQPFETKTIDRTPPVTLEQLRDLAEYKAASASFEVLIDTEEDVKYLPAAVAGERTFFIGVGSVDAVIDFDRLTPERIQVAEDRTSATIVLPRARLLPAVVDPEQSHVAARKRGALNRLAGLFSDSPTGEQDLYLAARAKMQAAAEDTELRQRAEQNTAAMLTSLVRSLGYADVTVRFEDVPMSAVGAAG